MPAQGVLGFLSENVEILICGGLVAALKIGHRWTKGAPIIISRNLFIVDFLWGVMIPPFFAILVAACSDNIAQAISSSNALMIGIAAVMGLVFVLGEILKT
jgi:hypothetical protein